MRRVVITGMGVVSPLGSGTEITWSRLINSQNGASRVTTFDVSDIAAQIACSVPTDPAVEGAFIADDWMEPKEQRKVDRSSCSASPPPTWRSRMPAGIPQATRIRSQPA
jgi:3-oxoacyl-[acyl-carrier-protein] synthase II